MKNYFSILFLFIMFFTTINYEKPLNEHERLTEIWQDYSGFIDWVYTNNNTISCDYANWSINPLIKSWYRRNCNNINNQ